MNLQRSEAWFVVSFISIAFFISLVRVSVAEAQTGQPGWKAQWENLIGGAKSEARVIVGGHPAKQYRESLVLFEKTFPDIKLEFLGIDGRNFAPRILKERKAGQFLWDVYIGAAETMYFILKPEGVLDPLMPALILPEVLDDNAWVGEFADGWLDQEKRLVYGFLGKVPPEVYVNRDLASDGELRRVEDLLDEKWRGKMTWHEPREAGSGSATAGYWLALLGGDFLKRMLRHDIIPVRDRRQQAEWVVRGRYPVAVALSDQFLEIFQEKGVGLNVKPLAPDTPAGGSRRLSPGGGGNIVLINRAPHPSAARVFINWLLSREAQANYARTTKENSRRLDVSDGPPHMQPKRGVKYINVNKEELATNIKQAMGIAKEILK